jgi:glycine betaine/proline transport system ATP-binding protein
MCRFPQEGEIFVLMGLSGSGKSTLIRLINRLMDPTDGQIILDGQDITKLNHKQLVDLRRRDMSMVFQSFALMPHRSVLDNAAFGLEISGWTARPAKPVAWKYWNKWAWPVCPQISARTVRRHAAACRPGACAGGQPSLMLMDEAFSALDPLKRGNAGHPA